MSSEQRTNRPRGRRTLAEILYYCPDAKMRQEVEEFRIAYEAEHGETDLTKRYTSTWETKDQKWLIQNHPKRYFDGLPPFVRAFIKEKMRERAREGNLDDESPLLLQLFISGQMSQDEGPSR